MSRPRTAIFWMVLVFAVVVPIGAAAMSPLVAWRDPIYVAAGFAGVIAMALMLFQPLLAGGRLPGLAVRRGRRIHRWVGLALVLSVAIHVAGLWITSPPDVIDALLFVSPTPFSIWGVLAMWGVFTAAFLVVFRRKLRLLPRTWLRTHKTLTAGIVAGSVAHAMMIEGTMEIWSKSILCLLIIFVTVIVLADL